MQMTRFAPSTMTATVTATRPSGRTPKLKRADQVIKSLGKQFVDLGNNACEFSAVKVPLHQIHDILNQQVSLYLHDCGRIRPDKQNKKVVARITFRSIVILVKFDVVKRNFNGCTG